MSNYVKEVMEQWYSKEEAINFVKSVDEEFEKELKEEEIKNRNILEKIIYSPVTYIVTGVTWAVSYYLVNN